VNLSLNGHAYVIGVLELYLWIAIFVIEFIVLTGLVIWWFRRGKVRVEDTPWPKI
jgi:cytochrome b subunit of formate dehydrogenase